MNHDVRQVLATVYFVEEHEDPHAEFARRLNISRQDAKQAYFRYIYNGNHLVGRALRRLRLADADHCQASLKVLTDKK